MDNVKKHLDSTIQDAVRDELDWTPEVDAAHIGVSAVNGAVTLSGEVDSYSERIAAKDAAFRVEGVTAVADDITVNHKGKGSGNGKSDTDIAEAVANALGWTAVLTPGAVQAEVSNHVVVLSGIVDWNYQRQAARRAVEHIAGVSFVDSRIRLARRPTAVDTVERIRNALVRNVEVDAHAITVTMDGTEVHLGGSVRSWAEKKQAEQATWASPNVTEVHNSIKIRPL